jgi:hypothetical protein
MRQHRLGALRWLKEDLSKDKKTTKKESKKWKKFVKNVDYS